MSYFLIYIPCDHGEEAAERASKSMFNLILPPSIRNPQNTTTSYANWLEFENIWYLEWPIDDLAYIHALASPNEFDELLTDIEAPIAVIEEVQNAITSSLETNIKFADLIPTYWKDRAVYDLFNTD